MKAVIIMGTLNSNQQREESLPFYGVTDLWGYRS